MLRWVNVIAFVIGGIAFAFVLDQLGIEGMRRVIFGVGSWFAVIAGIDLCAIACDAFGLHGFLRAYAPISYWKVLPAQASGMAINRLTPANSLGEPVKVTMLALDVPASSAVSAVVMFNLANMYVGLVVIAIGVPVTALLLDLPHDVAVIAWIALGVLGALGIAVGVLLARGALATLVHVLARLGAISDERSAAWAAKLAPIDERLRDLGRAPGTLWRGFAGVIASRIVNGVITLAILHAAEIPMTAPLVVAMLSVGILVTWVSNLIPLGLGIADSSNYVLYALLGASPAAGLVYTMVNRVRTVVLALMGLAVMGIATVVFGVRRQARNTSV